jgi:hypothetical protein
MFSERVAEGIAYALAATILVVGGAILRTPILNWICGPAIVIATVSLLPPLLTRSRAKQ